MQGILKLLSISDESLSSDKFIFNKLSMNLLESQLKEMISLKNGFYAFGKALHVFPYTSCNAEIGLLEWNNSNLWKNKYKENLSDVIFFAEDVFGTQFCIKDNKIFIFEPETGDFEYFTDSLEEWAKKILTDHDILTGSDFAQKWSVLNGTIPAGKRILPKIPFVLGGEYSLENIYLGASIEGMRFRASIANQIKDLPNGANIKIDIN